MKPRVPSSRFAVLEVPVLWAHKHQALARLADLLQHAPPDLDLVLLPETAFTGYVSPSGDFDLRPQAETLDGPTIQALRELARRHALTLVAPWIERHDAQFFNSTIVLGPEGQTLAQYRKRHPWLPETWATPGQAPPPVFSVGTFRCTLAVCYDLHFLPDDAATELNTADVLLFSSAWVDREDTRPGLLSTLAKTFELWCFNANWGLGSVPKVHGQGRSLIVAPDGHIAARTLPSPEAQWLVQPLSRASPEPEAITHGLCNPAQCPKPSP